MAGGLTTHDKARSSVIPCSTPFTLTAGGVPRFRADQSADAAQHARAVAGPRLHGRRAVAPRPLGGVQRGVGAADELLGALARVPFGHADRGPEPGRRRRAHAVEDLLGL